jgi:hypothetical protein
MSVHYSDECPDLTDDGEIAFDAHEVDCHLCREAWGL